jgi:hypothetical protein
MGGAKEILMEQAEKGLRSLDHQHRGLGAACPYCHGAFDRETCESFRWQIEKDGGER